MEKWQNALTGIFEKVNCAPFFGLGGGETSMMVMDHP